MKLTLSCLLIFAYTLCLAQSTVLDKTFGDKGIALSPHTTEAFFFDFDKNGYIISSGYNIFNNSPDSSTYIILTKHDKNGMLDTTFGDSGIVTTRLGRESFPDAMTITADDKIIIAGHFVYPWPPNGPGGLSRIIARYQNNGNLDSSFGINGIVVLPPLGYFNSALELPGKKILLGGYFYDNTTLSYEAMLTRFNSDGSIDNQFGINGIIQPQYPGGSFVSTKFISLSDGNLLLIGADATDPDNQNPAAIKIDTNGNVINTFANNGRLVVNVDTGTYSPAFRDAEELPDGSLLLFGYDTTAIIVKANGMGTFNSSFGINGVLHHNYPMYDAAVLKNGKIVLAGFDLFIDGFNITMLDSMGIIDTSFNHKGHINFDISSGSDYPRCVKVQDAGKIIVSGGTGDYHPYNAALLRINTEKDLSAGNITHTGNAFVNIYPNPFNQYISIETSYTITRVRLYNSLGIEVRTKDNYLQGKPFSLENIAPGIYYIQIETINGSIVNKQIVKLPVN